jgi:hypothetical protein
MNDKFKLLNAKMNLKNISNTIKYKSHKKRRIIIMDQDDQPNNETHIIKIQKWFRGCMLRLKQMPLILYMIQKYLKIQLFQFSTQTDDGRINSCIDECEIIKILTARFGEQKIKKPKIRMWYDILVYDNMYGWFPVNIKTTTTLTSDNTGNLTMCAYAYTDENFDIHKDETYTNGKTSVILFNKLKNKNYNPNHKKDYYFIVLNKNIVGDVIINSIKGLSQLTPNINNLPFQICWNKNRTFQYENINKKIQLFTECLQKPNPSWKETFMTNIRTLDNFTPTLPPPPHHKYSHGIRELHI